MAQAIIRTIGCGREGHDYSAISSWDAAVQGPREVINVGVVFPSLELYGMYPTPDQALESLIRWSSEETFDFLLIHASGEIIAWKHGSEIHRNPPDIEAMFVRDRDLPRVSLVTTFVEKFFQNPCPTNCRS
jgi:hypothetical protein